jgi:hypothetical protein
MNLTSHNISADNYRINLKPMSLIFKFRCQVRKMKVLCIVLGPLTLVSVVPFWHSV